jgi:acyl carrier protein
MSAEERLLAEIVDLCSEFAGFRIEQSTATFVECGLDSLVQMQLGMELGKRYGVSIGLRDFVGEQNTLALLAKRVIRDAAPDRLARLNVQDDSAAEAGSRSGIADTPGLRIVDELAEARLLVLKHMQPVVEGAFRAPGPGNREAWYVFDTSSRQYLLAS